MRLLRKMNKTTKNLVGWCGSWRGVCVDGRKVVHLGVGRMLGWKQVVSFLFILGLVSPFSVSAQSLDDQMRFLLNNDCTNLNPPTGGSGRFTGTALATICDGDGGGVGVSSGGGAGSAQSLGITVENRRREQLEGKDNQNNSGSSVSSSLNLGKGVSVFVTGNFEALNRDITPNADGFDSTILGGTLGGDYRINDQMLAGAAFNFTNTNGDFDGGGDFNTDAYGIIFFGSFIPAPGFFIDLAGGYSRNNYEVNRSVSFSESGGFGTISGTASSDTDADVFSFRALVGHDHTYGNVTVGPRVGLNYTNTQIDGYTETGSSGLELVIADQSVNSLQSVVGLQGSMAVSTSYGVWVPQASADYIHEFANSQRFIEAHFALDPTPLKFKFQNDETVRNFFNLGLGTVLMLPNGLQPFVNFRAMVGNEQFNNYAGTIGIRIEG